MDPTRLLPRVSRICIVSNPISRVYLQRQTTRLLHNRNPPSYRSFHHSRKATKDASPTPSTPTPTQQSENESVPSLNLWRQIQEARPAVRYTLYAGFAIMATAESTFWFNVIRAKYFPSTSVEEKEEADQLLERMSSVVKGFRKVWLVNYGRYYGAHLWGVGYGGLDGLEDEQR